MIGNKWLKFSAAGALALGLLVGQSAAAGTLTMRGEWFMNRGPLVDIPANGGPVLCFGADSIASGCVNNLRPANGGIRAAGTPANVVAGGAAAQFTVPSGAFGLAGGTANRQTVPVVGIDQVIQLASQFSLLAPTVSGGTGGIVPGGAASFQANAWQNDPIQTGGGAAGLTGGINGVVRLGANFTWCPPDGNCDTTAGGSQIYGKYRAQIKYTAGQNAFGGTMNMMLRDTGVVSIRLGATSGPVLHQLVGGTSNPNFGKQNAGGGYANTRQLQLEPGPMYSTYMLNTPCTSDFGQEPSPAGCGVIASQGNFVQSLPGSQNFDFGMPWTTGTVVAQNLEGGAGDPATTFTIMGTDRRTALGAGRITLVAGATTERKPTGNHFSAAEVLNILFDPPPAPLLSWQAIVAMSMLMLIAGGYMARHRFAGQQQG
jgi:hypothetical protein